MSQIHTNQLFKKDKLEGYFTVEASFVVTLVCVVIIAFIIAAMMCHDKVVATQIMNEELLQLKAGGDTSVVSQARSKICQRLQKELLICELDYLDIDNKYVSISGELRLCCNMEIPILSSIGKLEVLVQEKHKSVSAPQLVRILKLIKDVYAP